MNIRNLLLLPPILLLVACAQLQPKATPQSAPVAPTAQKAEQPAATVAKAPALPNVPLTEQLLYQFLVAEVAGQRGNLRLATDAYLDLARSTQDPRLARRATEIAVYSRLPQQALEASSLWLKLEPEDDQAQQAAVALLIGSGHLSEARPLLEKLLAGAGEQLGRSLLHLNSMLARQTDKQGVLDLVQDLTAAYGGVPEAHVAVAQAAWNAGKRDLAESELRRALELHPGWEVPVLMQGQLLQSEGADKTLQYYADFLKQHPDAKDVRLAYARLLVSEQRYQDAREEFLRIAAAYPKNPEIRVALGLLSMQLEDYDRAEADLKQALELQYKDGDALRIYLGQLNEKRERYAEAARWYGAVEEGDHYLAAQIKYAAMLAKQGDLPAARKHLQELAAGNNAQRVLVVQAEAQLLGDAKQYHEAYDLLSHNLEKLPNSPGLLYDRAMAAEKIGRIDVVEQDLRKLIQLKPDYAQAYNALGYTLADRNVRLDEALKLIEKALKLSPKDPFIMDSMGWVQYRLGSFDKAVDFLRSAYAVRPDPEIAAHLGEVLWVQGKKEEARQIWNGSLKMNPQNEALLSAIRKFSGK
jgi:tetratricopeptide (TPR) repeat protein